MTSSVRLVAAVVGRLAAELPSALAAAGLPAVTEFLDYSPAPPQPGRAPQVWVDLLAEDRELLAAYGGVNAPYTRNRVVAVHVTSAGEDASEAAGRLRSCCDLVLQVMEADQTAGGEGLRVQWMRTEYSGNMARSPSALFQEATLTFSIPRWAALGTD